MNRIELLLRCATLFSIMLGLLLFEGCTVDNVRQGLYEGVRTQNNLQSTPSEHASKPESPDYQEYQRLRKEQGYSN